MTKELTPVEADTLNAYATIAANRNRTHADPDIWRAEAQKLKALMRPGRILDIGCGSGRDALLLESMDMEYTGVDLSPEMLAAAREMAPDADFRVMSLYSLRFAADTFAAFWAAAVWLHVPRERIQEALREAHRVTLEGGVGFIALKEGDGEHVAPDGRGFTYWRADAFSAALV